MTGLWLETCRRWASPLPADTALHPCAALSQRVGVLGHRAVVLRAATLPGYVQSIASSPGLSLCSPQSVSLSSYFCLQKALNRLAGKEEPCQSLSSDASRINCRDRLRQRCKGGEGPGLAWKSWGATASGPSYQGGSMGSESGQNSPDGAQQQCWILCLGTPVLTKVGCNSSAFTGLLQKF